MFNKHTLIFKCCHTTSKNTITLLAENNTVACCINFVKVWSKVVSVWARCSLVHNLITHIFLALACMFDNRLFKASFLGFSSCISLFLSCWLFWGHMHQFTLKYNNNTQKQWTMKTMKICLCLRGTGCMSKFEISHQLTSSYRFATILVPLDWLITNLLFGLKVVCSEILVMLTKVIEDYVMLYLIFVNQDRW